MHRLLTSACVLALIFCLFTRKAFSQAVDTNSVFIVDSLLIKDAPDPDDTLMMTDIAAMTVIKDKDSLQRMGYAGYDKVTYIYTKAFRIRPDSLRSIPTTKQMAPINGAWLLHGTAYTGRVIDYYLSGRKKEEAWMVRGAADGIMRQWYQNGQLELEREYKAGKMDGMDREYYGDGSLWREGRFVADSAEGTWKAYFPNGQVKLTNHYLHGQLIDSAVKYYSTGRVNQRFLVENGKPVLDPSMKKIDQLLEKIRENESKKNFTAALRDATKMVQLDTTSADAYFVKGTIELNDHRIDEAIADLDKALTIEPYFDVALANRAFARIQKYQRDGRRQVIPPAERERICADLRKAAFLGDKEESVFDALKQYCQ